MYAFTYWTGRSEIVEAPTAHEAALTFYDEDYLHVYAIDPILLGEDEYIVLSEDFDTLCTITLAI